MAVKVKKDKLTLWLSVVNLVLVLLLVVWAYSLTSKVQNVETTLAEVKKAAAQNNAGNDEPAPIKNIEVGINPVRGNKNAKVVIVAFSDFQCPFCSRVIPSLAQIEKDYGDKVGVYFRNFPLPFHENAEKAAEAAECANEQGKFWEMHDKLFANQGALAVTNLKGYAKELGLDQAKFDSCLDSNKMQSVVQADMAQGQSYGVSGTPSFFINGKSLVGAQPYANFKAVIDAELAK